MTHATKETFADLGVELYEGPTNLTGDCPFCGKEEHFFVDAATTKWDCKSCTASGNLVTFMTRIAETIHRETPAARWLELSAARGLPPEAFKVWKMGWKEGVWWIPCRSEKDTVRDIRRWNGKMIRSTTGCHLQLGNAAGLAAAPAGSRVWVCEGEWDAMALRWLLSLARRKGEIVSYVPGAGVFKREWAALFKGHDVVLCYDNDEAGDKGSARAAEVLAREPRSIRFLHWPDTLPRGWDIRDYVVAGRGKKITAKQAIDLLEGMCHRHHRRDAPKPEAPPARPEDIIGFVEVLKEFGRAGIRMDQDFKDGLAIALGTCLANEVPGDPLWVYIVGPPSSGKTLILCALQGSDRVIFKSNLTPASLVSGFRASTDPSLLPKLDGKTAVFKDGTELLALNAEKKKEIYGTLRGAYDGQVDRPFGNAIERNYKVHFNMLIGVTPIIHGDVQSLQGERFLKYEMHDNNIADTRSKMRAAIQNVAKEAEMQEIMSDACRRFLLRKIDPTKLPVIPDHMVEHIMDLAETIAMLRAQVERELFGDRDIKYRPKAESPMRLAKQLTKLGQMLTVVLGRDEIDAQVCRIMDRVAMDTMIGFHRDIVHVLSRAGEEGLTTKELAERARIPQTSLQNRLKDLHLLDVIIQHQPRMNGKPQPGPVPVRWALGPTIKGLWNGNGKC